MGERRHDPVRRTAALRDVEISYLDWEGPSPGSPVLLLLHGVMGCAADWSRVAPALAGEYRVLAPDQRGHGASTHPAAPGGYATRDYLGDLEAFTDGLGIARFGVLGHGMGGHNAIGLAARRTNRVLCALANDVQPAPGASSARWEEVLGGRGHPVFGRSTITSRGGAAPSPPRRPRCSRRRRGGDSSAVRTDCVPSRTCAPLSTGGPTISGRRRAGSAARSSTSAAADPPISTRRRSSAW